MKFCFQQSPSTKPLSVSLLLACSILHLNQQLELVPGEPQNSLFDTVLPKPSNRDGRGGGAHSDNRVVYCFAELPTIPQRSSWRYQWVFPSPVWKMVKYLTQVASEVQFFSVLWDRCWFWTTSSGPLSGVTSVILKTGNYSSKPQYIN